MRITYIQQHFATQSEPGFVRAWEFCRRLVDDGHEVIVVRGGTERNEAVESGVRILSVKSPYENEMRFRRRFIAFFQFAVGATVVSIRSRPHLVYASSTPLTVVLPALFSSLVNRASFVFEVRDLWPSVPRELGLVKNPVLLWMANVIEKIAYSRADSVVALSPDMARGVTEVDSGADVTVVPNGCDMTEFDQVDVDISSIRDSCSVPPSGLHIVYAGGFGFMYDLPWAIELAEKLSGHGVYFTFIGRGSETENLKQLARNSGIYREGMFPGRLPKRDVIGYLKSSDILLSVLRDAPSLEACSLNKVFDAMAARRPLILNHGGWLTEEVERAGGGWRVSRDPGIAAARVLELSSDRESLANAGVLNRVLGEEKFDRDDQYLKFRKVVDRAAVSKADG